MLDLSRAKEPAHYCQPPEIVVYEADRRPSFPPRIIEQLPEGTRFICDECHKVLVVTWYEGGDNGKIGWTGRWDWRRETFLDRWLPWR
jgi:hypothetical protein